MNKESFFTTTNLKLAAALTAAGFTVRSVDKAEIKGREQIIVELSGEHEGVKAQDLAVDFEDYEKAPHADSVDKIFAERGLTAGEQVLVNFDAARTAGHNRVSLLKAAPEKPLRQISVGGGRILQFREGTPREELKRICR